MIKNLGKQLNEAGKIKIGIKGAVIESKNQVKFRPPVKLDHFILTTTEKDDQGDYVLDTELMDKVKINGLISKNNLVGIPIRLIQNDIEKNFPTRYVSYVKGKLVCTGDGEVSTNRRTDFKQSAPCPCERSIPGYDGKEGICKPTGTLSCIIDDAKMFGQAHVFRTTSINTIKGIIGGMELLLQATGGRIAWLPLMLNLTEKNTTTPGGGIPTKIYIVSICFRGNIDTLRANALSLIGADNKFFLEAETAEQVDPVPVVDSEDEQEFINEFFPSEVDKDQAIETEKVDTIKKSEDTKPEDIEPENSPPVIEKPTLSDEHKAQLITPDGEALIMYKRFLTENTYDRAYSCAKRLKKGHLLFWLQAEQPRVTVNCKDLKPALLEIVSAYLVTKFKKAEESKEESGGEMIDENGNGGDDTPEDSPANFNPQWDDSGPAIPDQLRVIIQSKSTLEKMGRIKPENWSHHVNFFQDVNGGKVETAKKLTLKQAYTFIDMLDQAITSKD